MKKGLEAGCLAIVDVEDATACGMEVVQMPVPGEAGSLVTQYARLITRRKTDILKYTTVLAVDGYFLKEGFLKAVTGVGLAVSDPPGPQVCQHMLCVQRPGAPQNA